MKVLPILKRRLKKYENLAREVLEGSTRFPYFFCLMQEGFFTLSETSYFFCLCAHHDFVIIIIIKMFLLHDFLKELHQIG